MDFYLQEQPVRIFNRYDGLLECVYFLNEIVTSFVILDHVLQSWMRLEVQRTNHWMPVTSRNPISIWSFQGSPDFYRPRSEGDKGSTINHLGGGRGAKRKKKIRSEGRRKKKFRPRGLRKKKLRSVNLTVKKIFFCVFPVKPCY